MPRVVIEIQVVNKACFLKCLHFCYTLLVIFTLLRSDIEKSKQIAFDNKAF